MNNQSGFNYYSTQGYTKNNQNNYIYEQYNYPKNDNRYYNHSNHNNYYNQYQNQRNTQNPQYYERYNNYQYYEEPYTKNCYN